MSGYYPYRFTTLHRAVSTALLCLVGSAVVLPITVANAATVGKTVISSKQYEPLMASIEVSDIKAANFDVSLAHSAVYQQMGLTPTNSMSVRFVTTSATTGRLIVSTLQPVSTPFADVVLTINDGERRTVVPKTLLMPLSNSVPIRPTTQTIASAARPNLPVVTTGAKPLAVRRGAPPPLFATPTIQALTQPAVSVSAVNTARTTPQIISPTAPVTSSISTTTRASAPNITAPIVVQAPSLPVQNNRLTRNQSINSSNSSDNAFAAALTQLRPVVNNNRNNAIEPLQPLTLNVPTSVLSANTGTTDTSTTDATLNRTPIDKAGLSITNTLSINKTLATTQNDDNSNVLTSPPTPAPVSVNVQQDLLNQNILNIEVNRQISISASTPINDTIKAEDSIVNRNIDNQSNNSEQAIASTDLPAGLEPSPASDQISNNITAQDIASASVSYTVQRNDNLWVISKQLAAKNNLDVQTVMKQIQAQNPDAFINQDASRLKANAQLNLPNYDIIPSQQSLQSAIQDQKSAKGTTDSLTDATDRRLKTAPIKPATTTATKTLPQARFSVIAPNLKGAANGTQAQGTSAADDSVSDKVLTTLRSSRTRTADQVTKIRSINNTLGNYTQKLQLQNQKLAELEARLKKLRNQ